MLTEKNDGFDYKKKTSKKVEKLGFFQRGYSMVLVKKWNPFHLFIWGKIGQENELHYMLEEKNACFDYKKTWKSRQNWDV